MFDMFFIQYFKKGLGQSILRKLSMSKLYLWVSIITKLSKYMKPTGNAIRKCNYILIILYNMLLSKFVVTI